MESLSQQKGVEAAPTGLQDPSGTLSYRTRSPTDRSLTREKLTHYAVWPTAILNETRNDYDKSEYQKYQERLNSLKFT